MKKAPFLLVAIANFIMALTFSLDSDKDKIFVAVMATLWVVVSVKVLRAVAKDPGFFTSWALRFTIPKVAFLLSVAAFCDALARICGFEVTHELSHETREYFMYLIVVLNVTAGMITLFEGFWVVKTPRFQWQASWKHLFQHVDSFPAEAIPGDQASMKRKGGSGTVDFYICYEKGKWKKMLTKEDL